MYGRFSVTQRLMWSKACVRVETREDGMARAPTRESQAQVRRIQDIFICPKQIIQNHSLLFKLNNCCELVSHLSQPSPSAG